MSKKKKAALVKKTGAEQRAHPRVPLAVLIQVKSDTIEQFRQMHAINISVGGMFIAAEKGPAGTQRTIDSQVFFQFNVKDGGTLIEGLGKVVHVSDVGIGVEFVSLLEPSSSIIRMLVEERISSSAAVAGP